MEKATREKLAKIAKDMAQVLFHGDVDGMSSWIDDESSSYLYMYDLGTGAYKGKLQMRPVPKWIQGVAYGIELERKINTAGR